MKKKCGSCIFFERTGSGFGLCHRLPPIDKDVSAPRPPFPGVDENCWCGEYKSEEGICVEAIPQTEKSQNKLSFFKKGK
jgi:hypothetical protein